MRMKSIASGSSGNSIYVGTDTAHVLVDAGISGKKIEAGLKELDLCGKDLDGILITHEHADHIGGLGVMLRRYQVPVYATRGTIEAMKRMTDLFEFSEKMDEGNLHYVLMKDAPHMYEKVYHHVYNYAPALFP